MIDFGYGVSLSSLDRSNLNKYLIWRNNHSIWQWCRQLDVISKSKHEKWFSSQEDDNSIRMYQINSGETPVGVCGLTSIDHINQRAEFSLYISPKEQGNGFGGNGLKTLCAHGFENLNLNAIWGESFEGNPATNTFENIGFSHEGIRRDFYFRKGKFVNAHIFSLLREDYKNGCFNSNSVATTTCGYGPGFIRFDGQKTCKSLENQDHRT